MRDPHRTRAYFLQGIEVQKKSITRQKEKILRGNSRNPDVVVGIIMNSHIEIAKYLFCLGEPIAQLYEPVYEAISIANKHDFADILGSEYPAFREMLSFAILLDLDQGWFDKLATVVDRNQKTDRLIENLLSYKLDNRAIDAATSIFFPNKEYLNALTLSNTDKQQAAQQVRLYLEEDWLDALRWPIHGIEVPHEKEFGYFGYWDYTSAAITKLCDLDDSTYRDSPYYPADLMPR